jgi:hypothetical protein
MTVLQLELNLWQQLAEAQQSPQAVDWQQLCLAFDQAMDNTPAKQKLAMAADAIAEMADVFAARADEFFNNWRRVPEDGPVLDDDLFAEFVRQSFHLDLDGLVGVPELYVRSASEKSHEDADSVVAEVSKEQALLLAGVEAEEELETPEDVIAQQGYDEDIAAWATAIRRWMELKGVDNVSISEVVNNTPLSAVKVWLSVLLSDFELERMSHKDKDFYNAERLILRTKTFVQCEVV